MKKLLVAFAVALALLAAASCSRGAIPSPEESGLASGYETASPPTGESAAYGDETSPAGLPSAEPSSQDGPQDELCREARLLLLLDRKVIDIFAGGALKSELEGEVPEFGEYAVLREDSDFAHYSDVTALLDSVYTDECGVKERYLFAFPEYGSLSAVRRGTDGRTEASFLFDADFWPDVENAEISFAGETGNGCVFDYRDGDASYVVTAEYTDDGLRLTDSLYFLEEERAKGLPWDRDADSERRGSCVKLSGECAVINVFASDSDSYWTYDAKLKAEEMLVEALDFLQYAAGQYDGEDLYFTVIDVDFKVGSDAAPLEEGGGYGAAAFSGTAYDGIGEFVREKTDGFRYDNVCVLFHFNKYGRSYSVPCTVDTSSDSDWFYEFSVLFYGAPDDGEYFACSAVYAHEILHAFGAKDLYAETVSELGDKLADAYFSTDIMRYVPTDIYTSVIGPLTAKLVGLEGRLDPQLKAVLDECFE